MQTSSVPVLRVRITLGAAVIVLLLFVLALGGCGRQEKSESAGQSPRPKVPVAKPLEKEIIEWDQYTGRFAAIESVDVRARVSGYLESIHFTDGAVVNKGDLLFVIDPRPFKAVLEQAQGQLKQAEAKANLAKLQLARQTTLFDEHAISRDTYDIRLSDYRQAEAQVLTARGAVASAELNLEFTEVRAPIRGRISRHLVTVGNLINGGTANSTLLTTIVSLDPVYFYFDVDERTYLRYLTLAGKGKFPEPDAGKTPAFAKLTSESDFVHPGHIDFVDTTVSTQTGSVRYRAVFPNPDLILVPGMFARVRIPASDKHKAILIPGSAVARDQALQFAYVINKDNVVERRNIEVGRESCGLRIVRKGLQASNRLILEGLQLVRPGTVVEPVEKQIHLANHNCLAADYADEIAEAFVGASTSRKPGVP